MGPLAWGMPSLDLPDNLCILRYYYNRENSPAASGEAAHISLEILYNPEERLSERGLQYRYAQAFYLNLYGTNTLYLKGLVRVSPEILDSNDDTFLTAYHEATTDRRIRGQEIGTGEDLFDYEIEHQRRSGLHASRWARYNGTVKRKFIMQGLSLDGMLRRIEWIFREKPVTPIKILRPFALYGYDENTLRYGYLLNNTRKHYSCSNLVNDVLSAGGFERDYYWGFEPYFQSIFASFALACLFVPFVRFLYDFGYSFSSNPFEFIGNIKDDINTNQIDYETVAHAYWFSLGCLIVGFLALTVRGLQIFTMGSDIFLGLTFTRPSTIMRKAAAKAHSEDTVVAEARTFSSALDVGCCSRVVSNPVHVVELNGADERAAITKLMRVERVRREQIIMPGHYSCPIWVARFDRERFPNMVEALIIQAEREQTRIREREEVAIPATAAPATPLVAR